MSRQEAINWIINLSADIGKIEHQSLWHYEQALSEIRELLEEDAVPVVRCQDCKYFNPHVMECEGIGKWFGLEGEWGANDYCSKAERKDDEQTN